MITQDKSNILATERCRTRHRFSSPNLLATSHSQTIVDSRENSRKPPSETSHTAEKQQIMMQDRQCRWNSCWNGQSLNGELLYKTVRASRERRLVAQATSRPQRSIENIWPGIESDRAILMQEAQMPKDSISDESRTSEDDPLRNPLYASVLGTSKQLQAISRCNSRKSDLGREEQRPPSSNQTLQSNRSTTISSEDRHLQSHVKSLNLGSCASFSSTSLNTSSSVQMNSLVERCLEVQRAIKNNGNLLEIAQPVESTSSNCCWSSSKDNYSNFTISHGGSLFPNDNLNEQQEEIVHREDDRYGKEKDQDTNKET